MLRRSVDTGSAALRAATSVLILLAVLAFGPPPSGAQGGMPDEGTPHEGTWLQWPHPYTYGNAYRNRLEPTWVAMTEALVEGETVHIIAYNHRHRRRIRNKLRAAGVRLADVTFLVRRTDDTWVRDNGPIFVYDGHGELEITDWGFNGWGFDAPYRLDDRVPAAVARNLGLRRTRLPGVVLEGGAIEVDGRGSLMATRSSILEPDRNPGLTEAELEDVLGPQLGIDKFIWLDGRPGGNADITDTHIDGFARFGDPETIVTMRRGALRYWGLSRADINTLYDAGDVDGVPYFFVYLPLTARNVVTSYGYNLGYRGSYVNFYVANTVVLVPEYRDPNDAVARGILQQLYPDRTVVGIDVRNLYRYGGMVHCVTQQQPAG